MTATTVERRHLADDARPGRAPAALVVALVSAGYLLLSLAIHHEVLGALTTSTVGSVASDSYLFAWWLDWLPHAVARGENPLFTTWQHYPTGVNAMWNTTVPVLAVLLAPVTLTAGPVAAFNTGMILGPVVSGVALVLALRPYVSRWAPRAVAGLLYGFGPFVLAHDYVGHINLVWAVLPPVLLAGVHAVLVRPRRPLLAGVLLGVAFAVQTVLYTQTVALGAIALVVTGVVLAARWPRCVASRVRPVLVAATACIAMWALLCAYPLYMLVAGPARPRAPIRDPAETGADAANVVVPTLLTRVQFGPGLAERLQGYPGEQGGYVGVALLAVVLAAVALPRATAIRIVAAVGAVLFVLSLGIGLVVLGHDTGVPLPWRLVGHARVLADAEPIRLQIFVALCVATVVALLLDRLAEATPYGRWVGTAAVLAAVVTWLPANVHVAVPTHVPAFFALPAAQRLHGDVVETVPRVTGEWEGGAEPLLWQATSGMAYRTTGGYFIGSDADHDLLLEGRTNLFQDVAGRVAGGGPPGSVGDAVAAAGQLRRSGVTVVLVAERPDVDEVPVLGWARQVTGSPAARFGDVWLFRMR